MEHITNEIQFQLVPVPVVCFQEATLDMTNFVQ